MKFLILLLTFSLPAVTSADTIKKWVDAEGRIHYGDNKAAKSVDGSKTLKIDDTYDPQAYQEGVERHQEIKELGDEMEKERIKEEKERKEAEKKELAHPPASNRAIVVNPSYIRQPVQLPSRRQ